MNPTTPMTPSTPPPLYGSPLIRAIRGPVLLIALGILFAIDSFAGISFARTWPVLLILFGLFKVLERAGGVGL